jgi:hypothetical protein
MKLFRKSSPQTTPAKPVNVTSPLAEPISHQNPRGISLSAEQKSILESPLDPRVDRILQEMYADKAAAEHALSAHRIIEFPISDSGERHVIQDEDGFWRIVPGPPPTSLNEFFDAI